MHIGSWWEGGLLSQRPRGGTMALLHGPPHRQGQNDVLPPFFHDDAAGWIGGGGLFFFDQRVSEELPESDTFLGIV